MPVPGPEPQPLRERPAVALGLLGLVLLALVVRVAFAVVVDPQVPEVSDAGAYHRLGTNLADGLGYIRPYDLELLGEVRPTAEYPPVLPAVLAIAATLGIGSVDGQQLVLVGLGTLTVAVVGLLGRRVGGDTVGLVAAGLAAVYPMLFQSDAVLMPETPFALLVATALLLAHRAATRPTLDRFVAAGAIAGLAALTRAEALLLAPLLLWPLAARLPGVPGRRRLLLAAAGVTAAVLVVAPWTIRNALRFDGALVPVSNNLGTALDGATCDQTWEGPRTGLWLYECFGGFDLSAQDEAEAAAFHRDRGLAYYGDHLGRLPAVLAVREARTFGVWDVEQQVDLESLEGRDRGWQALGLRTWWVLAPLAAAGAVLLVRRHRLVWPLVAPFALVVVTAAVTYGNQRFRVAAEPATVVLAAVALVSAGRAVRRRGSTSPAGSTSDRGAPAPTA